MTRKPILAILAAAALALGACGDDDEPAESGSTAAEAPTNADEGGDDEVLSGKVTLNISDFDFAEKDVTVEAGTTVTWKNADDAIHTATAEGDGFDTGDIPAGGSGEATLDEPGTYAYICVPHPFMKASITVE